MKILVVGAGVIGTVYGAQLGAAGHAVSVLGHGGQTDEVAREGLHARDVLAEVVTNASADVLDRADAGTFDVVLVARRRDHLAGAADLLAKLPDVRLFCSSATIPLAERAPSRRSGCGVPGIPRRWRHDQSRRRGIRAYRSATDGSRECSRRPAGCLSPGA